MGADQNLDWHAAAASLIDWWRDAGVDTLVDEAPHDWLVVAEPLAYAEMPAARPPGTSAVPAAPAGMPGSLVDFLAWRIGPDAPEAGWPGARIGPEGDAAGLFVVTDMPEREDLAAARLLSGAAGRLFDRMLAAIGLDRSQIHLVPVATARPPAGRIAEADATALGAVMRRHLALARPRRVLLLGDAASRAVLAAHCSAARGRLHHVNHDGGDTTVVASFHPRLLLERPAAKADAWRDLRMLMRIEA